MIQGNGDIPFGLQWMGSSYRIVIYRVSFHYWPIQHRSDKNVCIVARVDKGREESIERAIWPVQDVFGKLRTRNSNIDQSEHSNQIANSGCGLEHLLTQRDSD